MEVTEKMWRSAKYQRKARDALKKLPNALKAIVATHGGPAGKQKTHIFLFLVSVSVFSKSHTEIMRSASFVRTIEPCVGVLGPIV